MSTLPASPIHTSWTTTLPSSISLPRSANQPILPLVTSRSWRPTPAGSTRFPGRLQSSTSARSTATSPAKVTLAQPFSTLKASWSPSCIPECPTTSLSEPSVTMWLTSSRNSTRMLILTASSLPKSQPEVLMSFFWCLRLYHHFLFLFSKTHSYSLGGEKKTGQSASTFNDEGENERVSSLRG